MKSTALYEDSTVRVDDDGVTVFRYYFPFATKKFIPYARIRAVDSGVLPGFGGRWRLWGTSDFMNWFALDVRRPLKDTAVVLDVGRRVAPTFTPEDSDAVVDAIRVRLTGG